MEPLSIGLALAQFAPSLLRYFGVGEKAATVAEKAIEIAKVVTGKDTPEDALNEIKINPELQIQFRTKIMENETELERLYLADRQDARKRDSTFIEHGTRNYRADFLTVGCIVVISFIFWKVWTTPDIPEFVKGIVTLLLGRFLGYMDTIFQFEFGSTRGDQTSKKTINDLVNKT